MKVCCAEPQIAPGRYYFYDVQSIPTMKRAAFILVVIMVLLGIWVLLLSASSPANKVSRYMAGRAQPVGTYHTTHYDWLNLRPFMHDRIWVFGTRDGTNRFNCHFDLRENVILGELPRPTDVVAVNAEGTKVLMLGPDNGLAGLKVWVVKLLENVVGSKLGISNKRTESFWLLELNGKTPRRIGATTQISGAGSRWYASPDGRYSCTEPTGEKAGVLVMDFSTETLTRRPAPGWVRGWWDDRRILMQCQNHDLVAYDVEAQKTNQMFSAAELQQALVDLQISCAATNVVTFASWNGAGYDFYLAEQHYEFEAKQCFLVKVERTEFRPRLKLIKREFQFAWGGTFNTNATLYLYQGESGTPGSGGNGAVYLRDLSNNSVRTLVPPDHKGKYAIPRFYGNEVIYYRDAVLWRIRLDGQHDVPLFPTTNGVTQGSLLKALR